VNKAQIRRYSDRACRPRGRLSLDGTFSLGQDDVMRGAGWVFSSYTHLRTMLVQGWQVEPPVYVRPRLRSRLRSKEENTYHFVLWNGDKVTLVSVLDCPEVHEFLASEQLIVDRL
jgi:hypothetical protein